MHPPLSSTPGRLEQQFALHGVRLTRQRRAILAVIEKAEHHLDAAQILRWARRREPTVDRVTVYRTLGLLKQHNLIDELDLMHATGDAHFYELRPRHDHFHITCRDCGKVFEFESQYLALLKRQAEKKCGFPIEVVRLEMGGTCPACQRRAARKRKV